MKKINKDKQKEMILGENLWKVMFNLSWPAVIAMVLYGLNSVFDAVFVGNFVGEEALAGVSLAYPLTQISLGIGSLIGVGAGSLLSILIGKNDRKSQKKLMGNVNYITILLTLAYMALVFLFGKKLLILMGGSGQILKEATVYLNVSTLGSIFWIYGLANNMIIRSEGKMKSAALVMGLGLLVNILANYVLIVIFDFGVLGAALGTNLGMLVYTLIGLFYFKNERASFETEPFKIYRDKETLSIIGKLGFPSLLMNIMSLIQASIIFNSLGKYGGVSDIAFYGTVFRIFTFSLTPIFGLMRALQPVIGINYGANNYRRVHSSFNVFFIAALVLTLPIWLVSMINPQLVLGLVIKNKIFDPSNLNYFRLHMGILPMLSYLFMAMTFFPAIEKGKPAAMIGIIRQVVFYIPLMILLPKYFGVRGIYLGTFFIDATITLMCVLMVRREFKRLLGEASLDPIKN